MMLRKAIASTALALKGHAQHALPRRLSLRPSPCRIATAPTAGLVQASRFSTTPAPGAGITPYDLTPDQRVELNRRKEQRDQQYEAIAEISTETRVGFDYLVEKCARAWTLEGQPPVTRETAREWIEKHRWMYRVFDVQYDGDGQYTCSKERVDAANMRVVRWWRQLYVDLNGPEIDMADVLASIPEMAPESPESQARREQVKALRALREVVERRMQTVREEQERLKKEIPTHDEAQFRIDEEHYKVEQQRHKDETARFKETTARFKQAKERYEDMKKGPKEARKHLADELSRLKQERKNLLEQENMIYGVGQTFKKEQRRQAKKVVSKPAAPPSWEINRSV